MLTDYLPKEHPTDTIPMFGQIPDKTPLFLEALLSANPNPDQEDQSLTKPVTIPKLSLDEFRRGIEFRNLLFYVAKRMARDKKAYDEKQLAARFAHHQQLLSRIEETHTALLYAFGFNYTLSDCAGQQIGMEPTALYAGICSGNPLFARGGIIYATSGYRGFLRGTYNDRKSHRTTRPCMAWTSSLLGLTTWALQSIPDISLKDALYTATLFAFPCFTDWQTCPIEELEEEHYNAWSQFLTLCEHRRYALNYETSTTHNDNYMFSSLSSILLPHLKNVIDWSLALSNEILIPSICWKIMNAMIGELHVPVLFALSYPYLGMEKEDTVVAEPVDPPRRALVVTDKYLTTAGSTSISNLPKTVFGLQLLKGTTKYLPFWCGYDHFGMRTLLVPSTMKDLKNMCLAYGLTPPSELSVLSPKAADIISVSSIYFPEDFVSAMESELVYNGLTIIERCLGIPMEKEPTLFHRFTYKYSA